MNRFKSKQTGILANSDLKTMRGKVIYWLLFAFLIGVCFISLLPTAWVLLTSFKDTQEIYSSFTFFPEDLSWSNISRRIIDSWKELELAGSILNTVFMSIGDLSMTIIVCGFGGYVLSKIKPIGTKIIFMLVVWTMMMPSQMRLVPVYISWLHFPFAFGNQGVNLMDTFWPMWLSAAANTFNVVLFKNSFDGLSNSYVEAGKLDGCGNMGVFFKIMLPLSMPVIIYVSIITLSNAWSAFFTPYLVLDKNVILPVQIYLLKSDTSVEMNTYFMGLIFASLPPFLIFLLFQRHIMGGINIGGVKG